MLRTNYILFIFFLLMVSAAYAEPVITINTKYYDISGQTNRALRREMSQRGPSFNNQPARYAAITHWWVDWNVSYQPSDYGCSINTVQTHVAIEFTYPRWRDRASARPNMTAQWDKFYQALVAHEQTHANHGISAAKQIENELLRLSSRYDCNTLRRDVANRAQQIIQHYQNEDIQFDRQTNHGANEGVRLP